MRISTKGRYALRLMLDLAENGGGEYMSLRDISLRQDISVKYLEHIVAQLCNMGLLRSVRGPQGGYKLVREPEQYTAGDILRATEGSLAPVACLVAEENDCPRRTGCRTLPFWEGLERAVTAYVDGVTLADLLENRRNGGAADSL